MRRAYKIFILTLLAALLFLFCQKQTRGFRFYELLSDLSDEPRWDTAKITEEDKERLNQPFTFIGKGGFCYAFLGNDQKTVIKFYAHHHLAFFQLFKNFSWEKLLLKNDTGLSTPSPHYLFCFNSCLLALYRAKEETGLIYAHLNKTEQLFKRLTLIDAVGVRHTIELDKTEFVLQHKAELLIDYINRMMREKKIEYAKDAIDSYLHCIERLCNLGIKDTDSGFKRNYGILENGSVIALDISSFVEDLSLQRPAQRKKQILIKSQNLAQWLKGHYEELFNYYDNKITLLLE